MSRSFDISVVIPAHNRASFILECLDSVVRQTIPPAEVLVVDDGSTDATAQLVAQCGHPSVRLCTLPVCRGAQAARNAGIKLARHQWIAFQDSDDLWRPEKLARQIDALVAHPEPERCLVHTNATRVDVTSGTRTQVMTDDFTGWCHQRLLLRPGPMFPCMLVHRDNLEKIGWLDEDCPAYQEWDTAIRLSETCALVHLREPLFEWRWHPADTISKNTRTGYDGYRYILEKNREQILRVHGESVWSRLHLGLMLRGIDGRRFDVVLRLLQNEPPGAVHYLLSGLARLELRPPGTTKLINAVANTLPR